ncbi:ribosomal protein RPL36 [Cardiosporidium cionae]|uniref:60S ribosomal protein L36 n=1 Tax=Cardiosporidium cionae TaxID=476202 RepID=A0ABQ7JFM9_9APIC|nr:ribosomal protein RPL36 [Cardiosporidium cionae]|eukprot:KAF8822776.1 ribosomal protein RPL36 [Cardiosporidium cionae]
MTNSGSIAVGIRKGYLVTKRDLPAKPVKRKGQICSRVKMIREVIREVAGFSPYERRIMELVKVGTSAAFKRALKFSKKRLGTHRRAKAKRLEMQEVVIQQRKKQAVH